MDQLRMPTIILPQPHASQMVTIAEQQAPIEACGIIAGRDQISHKIFPISNSLNSPVEFLMDSEEMVKAFWEIEELNLEAIAFFHSHPATQPLPSQTDLKRNYYPETPHLIVGLEKGKWAIRGFILSKNSYQEIQIKIV